MASVLIGNSCQTQTLQGLGRMGVARMEGDTRDMNCQKMQKPVPTRKSVRAKSRSNSPKVC